MKKKNTHPKPKEIDQRQPTISIYLLTIGKFLLAATILIFLFYKSGYLSVPLDRDEGSLLYSGYCFVNGKIPYVDFYEIKPPGIFLIYGIFHLIFGFSTPLLHTGLILLQFGIALILYKSVVLLFRSQAAGLISAIFILIFCMSPILLGFALMSEFFLIFFILLSYYFLLLNNLSGSNKHLIYSGLAFGMAAMIRQQSIFFLIPYLLLLLENSDFRVKPLLSKIKWSLAGAGVVIIPLLSYILILGSFDDMIYWIYKRPFESFVQEISFSEGSRHLKSFLYQMWSTHHQILTIPALGLILLCTNWVRIRKSRKIFLLTLLIFSVASVFPGNRFYGHYWINTLPALAILTGIPFTLSISDKWRYYLHTILFIFVVLIGIHLYKNKTMYFEAKPEQIYQKVYNDNPNFALSKITAYLKNKIKAEEEVFVFGSEPQVYYECRSIPKTRHSYIGTVHVPGSTNIPYQNEVINYLIKEKPKYIVHVQYAYSIFMTPQSSQKLYNWIFSFENNNYYQLAIAEEDSNHNVKYLFDKDALNYNPTTEKYIILYARR
ncbi:MAG: glycosyltransferase family 39 protein [Saprospiraceae bacterium]|nr:glycosyltransferase family 39 protein [Saprospiraceae bacterium]